MKRAVVVLACLASVALGAPEADPQVVLNAAGAPVPFPFARNTFPFGASPLLRSLAPAGVPAAAFPAAAFPAGVPALRTVAPVAGIPTAFNAPLVRTFAAPVPAPVVRTVAPAAFPAPVVRTVAAPIPAPFFRTVAAPIPAPIVRHAAPLVRTVPHLTPDDCVTVEGCLLRSSLIAHGRTTREAESDPQLISNVFNGAAVTPAALNPLFYNGAALNPAAFNPLFYNGAAFNPAALNPLFYNGAVPFPAAAGIAPLPAAAVAPAQTIVLNAAPVAPVAPVARIAPVAPVAPIAHPAPLLRAVPRPLRPTPILKTVPKVVTYTHLGAHPIQPTTIVRPEVQQVGVALA